MPRFWHGAALGLAGAKRSTSPPRRQLQPRRAHRRRAPRAARRAVSDARRRRRFASPRTSGCAPAVGSFVRRAIRAPVRAAIALDMDVGFANGILDRARLLAARLADGHLLDHAGALADHRLLGMLAHLERLLAECFAGSGTVDRAALDLDVLFGEVDRLAHRLLDDAAIDAHAPALDVALADDELLLGNRYRTLAGRINGFARAACFEAALPALLAPFARALLHVDCTVALEDGHRLLDFPVVVRCDGHQDASAPHALGVVMRIFLGHAEFGQSADQAAGIGALAGAGER